MVAIITGNGFGLERSSASVLGSRGQLGSAGLGRGGESVFVNAATGNLIVQQARDELLIGRGPDAVINRTYNSLGTYSTIGGAASSDADNWWYNTQRKIVLTGTANAAGSTATLTDWDGSVVTFAFVSATVGYQANENPYRDDKLLLASDVWTWTEGKSGRVEKFQSNIGGRITESADTDGNKILYSYDAATTAGKLTTITTQNIAGQVGVTAFTYSGTNVTSVVTSYNDTVNGATKTLTRVRYGYDASNRLTSVTVDLSPEDGVIADGRTYVTNYTYDGTSKRIATISQTDGTLLSFTYDGSGRVATFVETVETGVTRTTTFTYGTNQTTITQNHGGPQAIDTVLTYDATTKRLTRKDEPAPVSGGNALVTTFAYNANGYLTQMARFDGAANVGTANFVERMNYSYDANGNLTEQLDAANNVIRWTYNTTNMVTSETRYTALDADGVIGGTAPAGAMVARYIYDDEANNLFNDDGTAYTGTSTTDVYERHLRFMISAEGRVTEYRYNAEGQVTAEIDYAGTLYTGTTWTEAALATWVNATTTDKIQALRTDTTYDFRGNISTVTSYQKTDAAGNGLLTSDFSRTIFVYDQYGNLLSKELIGDASTVYGADISTWTASSTFTTGSTLDGAPARQLTVQTAGVEAYANTNTPMVATAGQTFSFTVSLQAVGDSTAHGLGLYGGTSYWGGGQGATARILSGPGTVTLAGGGYWEVSGLSTTEVTRVEIIRTYAQAESVSAIISADYPMGRRAGRSVLISKPVITKLPMTETYAYDGLGRTIRYTDAKGVGTWTTYADTQNRTVVTLANGLTTTSSYNRAGEMVASSEARGGIAAENLVSSLSSMTAVNLTPTAAGTVDGAPATQYTLTERTPEDSQRLKSAIFQVNAGDTVTASISFMATATSSTNILGILGYTSVWGANNISSARIVSGPGSLEQYAGGAWNVTGLSTTQATRIEITRTFTQNESADFRVYPDYYGAHVVGNSTVISAPSVVISRYDTSASGGSFVANDFNLNQVATWGLSAPVATTLAGSPANTYTLQTRPVGDSQGMRLATFTANAGDTFTQTVILQGGTSTSANLGLLGDVDGWNGNSDVLWSVGTDYSGTARIISGPGTLVQNSAGHWSVTGLSSSTLTRIEISRTFTKAESGDFRIYPDFPQGSRIGTTLTVGAPSLVRTPGSITSYKYDSLGRLRIKVDPVGARTFFFYDRTGRLVGEVDSNGSVTETKYDAADRVVATVRYANAYANVAGLSDGNGNPSAIDLAAIKTAIGASAADRWGWNVYDKQGRLTGTIDGAGAVQKLDYDGAGRLTQTTRYSNVITAETVNGANGISGYRTALPATLPLPTADAAADRIVKSYYDNDGLLRGTLDEDNFFTEIKYDNAGRKVESVRYTNAAPSVALSGAVFTGLTPAPATDIRNYWIYDGRGLLAASIDGEGNVTNFYHTAKGQVSKEIRGRKLNVDQFMAASEESRSLASLQGWYLGGHIEEVTDFSYDLRGQLQSRILNLENNQTQSTYYAYDSTGNLIVETTSETVSPEIRKVRNLYDAKGRLIATLSGNGIEAGIALGANPTQAQIDTVYATHGTRFVYDAADRLISKITPDGTGAAGNRTVYFYDTDGQLRYEINALGEVMEYRYNALEDKTDSIVYGTRIAAGTLATLTGGLVTTAVTNAVTAIANSAVDSRSQFVYNNRGLLQYNYRPGTALNDYQSYYYNAFGEVNDQYAYPQADQTDRTIHGYHRRGLKYWDYAYLNGANVGSTQTTYSYDAFGRVTYEQTNNTDWRGTQYWYDRRGLLVGRVNRAGNNANFGYDSRANMVWSVDGVGKPTVYAYDLFNRNVTTTTPEGVVSTVKKNAYGQTIQITDGAGRTTSYTYDKNGNLKTVTDAAGTTTNVYDNADRLIEIIDARGYKTVYTYDAVGRVLTKVQDPTGLNYTTTYAYDAKGQQISMTDARGTVSTYSYDLKGQKTEIVQDYGVGIDPTTSKPYLNLKTVYIYRNDGKVISMTEGVGSNAARTTAYEYDSMGRLLKTRVDPAGLNLTTTNYYDVNNNIVAVTDERGNTTRFVYDRENRLIWSVSALGEVTENGYDAEGRSVWTRSYANRILQTTVDSWNSGFTWDFTSDHVYYNVVADNAKDQITRSFYDGDGRRAYAVDAEGYVSGFVYDGANNITKTVVFVAKLSASNAVLVAGDFGSFNRTSPPGDAAVTSFAYDAANRLTSTTDAEGYTESYNYDAAGNRTGVTNKLGGYTNYGYDALGRLGYEYVAASIFDSYGNQIDAGYHKVVYGYDAVGNIAWQSLGYGLAEGISTYFYYDKANRLIQRSDPTFLGQAPNTYFQYDARGNVVLQTNADQGKIYSYYDAENRKVAEISPVNTLTTYSYDAHGNATSMKVYATAVTPTGPSGAAPTGSGAYRETQYGYDRENRLTSTTVLNVRTGSYNGSSYVSNAGQNLVSSVEYDAFGNVSKETDANGNSIYHWYDRNGRETQKLDAEGYYTSWTRDEDGNVTSERRHALQNSTAQSAADRVTNFTYDKNGRRTSETRVSVGSSTVSATGALAAGLADSTIQYSYNGLGEVTRKIEANGDTTTYSYDNQGRLTWQLDPLSGGYNNSTGLNDAPAHHRTWFFYDGLGNLVRTTEQAISVVNGSHMYATGYDSNSDRITRYGYDGGKLRWTIDANGFQRNNGYDIMGRQTYNEYQRTQSNGNPAPWEANITSYDTAGRVQRQGQGTWNGSSYTWNDGVTENSYNSYGEVVSRKIGSVVNNSWAVIEQNEYDNAGRLTKTNSGDGVWKFLAYDANGNATVTISSAGADLSGQSLDSAFGLIGQEDVNATYVTYDKRNMAELTYEEGRRLSATNVVNISTNQTYNAFGEVESETDAHNQITNYTYNTMGRLIRKESPFVHATAENGATSLIRPTENYAYDISGRLVGTQDANGWWTTRLLLAGTGHAANGDEALVTKEFRPDSSVWETQYDVFRDARMMLDGLGRTTHYSYDKMHRVTQITRPATAAGTLIESYSYDGLGQRLKSWNNLYGAGEAATTDYDIQGRVIRTRAQGGDVTTMSYAWDSSIATTGPTGNLGTFGGWVETTTFANERKSIIYSDIYGRETAKKDLGDNYWRYHYDKAGRMVLGGIDLSGTISSANRTVTAYYNSGLMQSITTTASTKAAPAGIASSESYSYDANGNRLSEYGTNASGVYKNASASYDALNRITNWAEAGNATLPAASTITSYDAVGNIRRTQATYQTINANGNAAGTATKDHWYRYDSQNRVVTDRGVLSGAAGAAGTTIFGGHYGYDANSSSQDILYDAAGQRSALITINYSPAGWEDTSYIDAQDNWITGSIEWRPASYYQTRESYSYDDAGRVTAVYQSTGALLFEQTTPEGDINTYVVDNGTRRNIGVLPAAPLGGTLRSTLSYDLLGRQISQSDYGGINNVTTPTYNRQITYNSKNQITVDDSTSVRARTGTPGNDTWRTRVRNDYDDDRNLASGSGSTYALGQIVWQHSQGWKNYNDGDSPDTMLRFNYDWWDGAVQSSVQYDKKIAASGAFGTSGLSTFNKDYTTSYSLNGIGQTISAQVRDGVPKNSYYTLDALGQIINRREARVAVTLSGWRQTSWTEVTSVAAPRELGTSINRLI
jgi:YD repeat-containing protein